MSSLHTIKGNVFHRLYYFNMLEGGRVPLVLPHDKLVEEKVIWEGELDLPMKSGDKIHILELDKTVEISNYIRTTDNKFIYSTNHAIEIIEDEETYVSKLKAEQDEEDYFKEYLKRKEERKLREQLEKSKQPWYKKLFK